MNIKFYKYQGTGNDFILIDNRTCVFKPEHKTITRLCNRYFGIGADGLILLEKHSSADFLMRYYNSDGGEATFCGNGSRCVVSFAQYLGLISQQATFVAADGMHRASMVSSGDDEDVVKVAMKDVDEIMETDEGYFVDSGSPHLVLFKNNITAVDVKAEGKTIRNHQRWSAQGVNVNFVEVQNDGLKLRTYERGVENETLSCGTGAVASAIAAAYTRHLHPPINVLTLGGKLIAHFVMEKNKFVNVQLEGPAKMVFAGNIRLT